MKPNLNGRATPTGANVACSGTRSRRSDCISIAHGDLSVTADAQEIHVIVPECGAPLRADSAGLSGAGSGLAWAPGLASSGGRVRAAAQWRHPARMRAADDAMLRMIALVVASD